MPSENLDPHIALHASPMRLTYAKALEGDHSLALSWENGERGVIRMGAWIKATKEVEPLLDPEFFSKCAIIDDGWSLGWPGDISMGWDQLYILAVEQHALRSQSMSGDQFRAWLSRNGLNQNRAAQHLGMTSKSINNYAMGHTKIPRTVQLACLAIDAGLVPIS
ncbi:MAG: DUF2442 domain-containing protein [Magnetococcales bacterium]|nr:DUF2442 domain-containing protein [Magnetococcales bacterium]